MYVKVYITTHRQQRVHTDHSHWQTGEVALTRFPVFTVVRNPKDELKTGTLRAMCAQLGIKPTDL